MHGRLLGFAAAALTAVALPAAAHHSFAIYDMSQNIEFEGVIETLSPALHESFHSSTRGRMRVLGRA